MGTTAEKLTYLNTTKGKIKDSINLTGAGITNQDTFRSYASLLKTGLVSIINNGIDQLYSNFPKVSGIGSNLSLTPTYEAPMRSEIYYGDTLQDGTPTPSSPIDIQTATGLQNVNVCGKNLLNIQGIVKGRLDNGVIGYASDVSELTLNDNSFSYTTTKNYRGVTSDYIPVNSNTDYVFSTLTSIGAVGIVIACYDKTKTFISDANVITISDTKTFTTVDNTNYIRIYFYRSSASSITIENPQLEQGSTATEYESYKGDTYEVNLGKNLFDINGTFTGNLIKYNNGFQLIKNSTNRTINYFPSSPIPKGTYTLSYEIVSSTLSDITKCIVQVFNSSNTQIATKQFSNDGYITFTTTDDITKLYFYISNTETDDTQITLDNIQLEKGTQSTSYSPYFTPIELNKIGDYQDRIYKDNGKWYVEKKIGKVVLNGTENWRYQANYDLTNTKQFAWFSAVNTNSNIGLSNYFKRTEGWQTLTNTDEDMIQVYSDKSIYIRINNTLVSDLATFKNWLSTHNTEVYYALATPTYTEITNTELIEDLESLYTAKSQEGTTNISITSEDLPMLLSASALKEEN